MKKYLALTLLSSLLLTSCGSGLNNIKNTPPSESLEIGTSQNSAGKITAPNESDYYENFRKKCDGSPCCLSSLKNAEDDKSLIYENTSLSNITCPDGFQPDALKCMESYMWCSPVGGK